MPNVKIRPAWKRAVTGFVAVVIGVLLTINHIPAQQASIEKLLPESYTGEFNWDGSRVAQVVEIKITFINRLESGQIETHGCGRYSIPAIRSVTNIRVRMVIDEVSRDVEIWESEPVGNSFFTTDGSHKGKMADDLQSIETEWTTRATGQKGKLRLRAGPSFICAPNVASLH